MVTVWAPASSANLGPGYDALGLALDFGCEVAMEETESGLDIRVEGEGAGEIPQDETNLVLRAASRVFARVRQELDRDGSRPGKARLPRGLRLVTRNHIPITRGLGSSAAAIAAGLLAADRLTGADLSLDELLALGTEMEGHPDNIAPALLGGITVAVYEQGQVFCHSFHPPETLHVALAVPDFHVVTEAARRLVPERVSLQDAVHNLGRSSLLVASVASGRWDLLRVAMRDRLHQPYRQVLVPGMEEAFRAAEDSGAAGVALSGSGPAVLALVPAEQGSDRRETAARVAEAMAAAFRSRGLSCRAMVTRAVLSGARVTAEEVVA